jgi:tetratricopeptide (TPR) repeat protein
MMIQGRSFSGRERNCCFLNTLADPAAKGRFANISAASGLDFADDGRAVSVVDWDHDGDLDLWISNRNAPRIRLLRNNTNSGNHFLAVRLVGNGKTTSRDAIGARLEVTTTGADNELEKVTVHWPGGEQETFSGLDVDGRFRLAQGSGKATDLKRLRTDLALQPSTPKLPPKASTARIPLVSRFPLPKGSYQGINGQRQPLPLGRGQSLVINLWSSSCRPCLTELNEFTQREKEIRAAGIEIVALSVDLLADDQADRAAVTALFSKLAFPFSAGFSSPELLKLLQMYHDKTIPLERPLPLPSSFLLDGRGRISVIYKGPVSVDQLLADARYKGGTLFERQRHAALLPGRLLEDETLLRLARMEQSESVINVAEALEQAGRVFDLIAHYEEALRDRPDNTNVHINLGVVLHELGRYEDSITHFKEALRYQPDLSGAHNNWANSLKRLGRLREALKHSLEAVRIDPNNAQAHNTLGITLDRLERPEESLVHFKEALRIRPEFSDAQSNWGSVLNHLGRFEEALAHFQEAVRIEPNFAVHANYGNALMELGRTEEAVSHYQKALRFNSNNAQVHNSCGVALGFVGRDKESIKHYEHAVRLDPRFAKAHYNLAWARATCPDKRLRNGQQALAHAQRANQFTGGRIPAILESIAAAHAELENFTEAVRWQEKAIQLASKKGDKDRSARLKLYKQRRPYRKSNGTPPVRRPRPSAPGT